MTFSSIHFLFLFFPITLILYFIIPNRIWRCCVLLLASLIFFGWASPTLLPLLVAVILFDYLYGLIIGRTIEKGKITASRIHMWTAVCCNILLLFFYKYLGLFGESFQQLVQTKLHISEIVMPLGISYFTFTGISYILDIYNGVEKPEKSILRFSTYLVMFPKFIQGPITRFKDVKDSLLNPKVKLDDITEGVRRFVIGLAKKVILADSMAVVANNVFGADYSTLGAGIAWYGLIAYALQIFFDFSGYTDMALGLGRVLGFRLPENFNYPYISRSIADFWRRWHMSLTAWFRTYLFLPLEFARKKEKYFRQQSNLFIVFLFTGLWHGASWNYVIWGGYFGLILALESGKFGKWLKKIPRVFQHVYSLLLILLGWMFFRINAVGEWGSFIKALIGVNGWSGTTTLRSLNVLMFYPIILLAIVFCVPLGKPLKKIYERKPVLTGIVTDIVLAGVFVLSVTYILSNGFSSFLYAQF